MAKWLSEEALQIAEKRREAKRQGRKGKIYTSDEEFWRIESKVKKALLREQWKEIEETTEWERLEISSRKLEIQREHFIQRQAQ